MSLFFSPNPDRLQLDDPRARAPPERARVLRDRLPEGGRGGDGAGAAGVVDQEGNDKERQADRGGDSLGGQEAASEMAGKPKNSCKIIRKVTGHIRG